jgi:hypothetical protein
MSQLDFHLSPVSQETVAAFHPVAALPEPFFAVLSAEDPSQRARWIAFWESWPKREVFAHPNYVRLFASPHVEPLCACWHGDGQGSVLYPFLLRRLEDEPYWSPSIGNATDLVTPYGYGGPFVWGADDLERLQGRFWRDFQAWARRQNVVAEFVRFSLPPVDQLPYPGVRKTDRQNVVRDLAAEEEALWMDFKHKVRKNVHKAQRSGMRVAIDPCGEGLDDFLRIYEHTMQRRHAGEGYYFSPAFFRQLHQGLPGQFAYFHAFHADRVVSTELVLVSAENVYSFLGGTECEAFELRPNDLVKFEIIRWAKAQGKKRFVLGGGYEPDDGIFQYKVAFAPSGVVPFEVGRRVIDPQRYAALVEARHDQAVRQGQVWQPREDYFPTYRA